MSDDFDQPCARCGRPLEHSGRCVRCAAGGSGNWFDFPLFVAAFLFGTVGGFLVLAWLAK